MRVQLARGAATALAAAASVIAILGCSSGASSLDAARSDASVEGGGSGGSGGNDSSVDGGADGTGDASADGGQGLPDAPADTAADAPAADAGAPDASGPAALCAATGGTVASGLCCVGTNDFPGSCSVGACGCSPTSSHTVQVCTCPAQQCYSPARGCVTPVCTPGAGQTCNDNPALSSIHGVCQDDGTCVCNPPSTIVPASGRCS